MNGYHPTFATGLAEHCLCWAHVRRRYFEVASQPGSSPLASEALSFIRGIYHIEAEHKDVTPDQRLAARKEHSVPLLQRFYDWLCHHQPSLLPRSPLGKAFAYTLSNWAALMRFTADGNVAPDSNLVERTIRPVAVGCAAAVAFSLIESCKLAGVEPYAYLRDVLQRIDGHRIDRLHELLPFNWKPAGDCNSV